MITRRILLSFLIALGLIGPGLSVAAKDEATALVKRTSERMLTTLEKRRAEVDRNPSIIFDMIESIVAPHFDFEKITQAAVGRHWRGATPVQQKALVNGFKQVLIRTYARSLLSYSGEQIRYLPVKPGSRKSTVTVATEVREPGAAPIPVDYRMYQSGSSWKVYDVVINNASLVGNYRKSFDTEIRQSGIDALVDKLGEMNRKGED